MEKRQVHSVIEIRLCLLFTLFYCIWPIVHYVICAYLHRCVWRWLFFDLFHNFCLWSVHGLSLLLPMFLILALFHRDIFFCLRRSWQCICWVHGFSWRADHIFAPWVESFIAVLSSFSRTFRPCSFRFVVHCVSLVVVVACPSFSLSITTWG